MRLTLLASLVVVTTAVALGGCAAEPFGDDTASPNIALQAPGFVEPYDRTDDVAQAGKVGDVYENPADEAKARLVTRIKGGDVDPRLEGVPSGFSPVPDGKIGAIPQTFAPLNPLEEAIEAEEGYLPFGHKPKP